VSKWRLMNEAGATEEKASLLAQTDLQVCTRCIYDERVSAIRFDHDGVCNYCHQTDQLIEQYGTGTTNGEERLAAIVEEIRAAGCGKKYDCIVGVSGGTDSSYVMHLAKKVWGLRPLAVHYDNTWNSAIATQNIRRLLSALDVDLYTHVINNKEADDLVGAFFRAGVAEIDSATDLALAEVMNRAAWQHGIRFVLEGHSFVTEGISPIGRNYFDGAYIRGIHKRFGRRPAKTYPLMTFERMLFWSVFAGIKKIRPFWYMAYSKEDARTLLEREYGWEYYGGHHLENRITAFAHSVYLPEKFGLDFRNNTLSALARQGKISREEAWRRYCEPPHVQDDLILYVQKRLGVSDNEYKSIMATPAHRWQEFPTYKKRFETFRPLFKLLADRNLVTRSFYLKYCFPDPESADRADTAINPKRHSR
jgi:N-acetyl sugar amidotransferase